MLTQGNIPQSSPSDVGDKRIFWFATVIDNIDPLMLNRVRVRFDTLNNISIINSVPATYKNKKTLMDDNSDLMPEFRWSEIDPFVLLPLIPLFVKTTPKINETVNVFWPNVNYKYDEQYYIQGTFSSPLTMFRENNNSQRMFAAKNRLKEPKLLKNPINYEYYVTKTKGVFIEPDDVGLVGRGVCDLVIKENDVLLRAGKSTTKPDTPRREIMVNPKRSFIQLSQFTERIENLPDEESLVFKSNNKYVSMLFEYNVLNPENTFDLFSYTITLYRLPNKPEYTTKNVRIDSNIKNEDKSLVYTATFFNESMDTMSRKIVEFIGQLNDGSLNLPPFPIKTIENQFPLFFRPAPETLKRSESPINGSEYLNVSTMLNKIDYKTQKNGSGLLWSKGVLGEQFTPKFVKSKRKKIKNNSPTSYGIIGGDKILLLSHESRIPSSKLIILDDTTCYGMTQEFILENITPNTNSMVRGEELMKLLNMIVRFLQSHTHAFPGLPSVPISHDGVKIDDIIQMIANSNETILNTNIRIN